MAFSRNRLQAAADHTVVDLYDLFLQGIGRSLPWSLSRRIARIAGGTFGTIHFRLRKQQRRRALERIALVFGELSPDDRVRLARAMFRWLWVGRDHHVLPRLATSDAAWALERRRLRIEGVDHLRTALEAGKGVVLWECFLGMRVLGKVALSRDGFALHQVHDREHGGSYGRLGQGVVRPAYRRGERPLFAGMLDIDPESLSYLRKLARILESNGIVCINALGSSGQKFVETTFLGRSIRVPTGTLSLSRMTGCAVIPLFCYDEADGTHRVILEPPIEQRGVEETVASYLARLETYVRRAPDQWPFWHASGDSAK